MLGLRDLLIGMVRKVHFDKLVDLVHDGSELFNALQCLVDGFKLDLVLADGLPFDGVVVPSLDQSGQVFIELHGVYEIQHLCDDDDRDWDDNDDLEDALNQGVVHLGHYSLSVVEVQKDLPHLPWINYWSQ
jgi:hypothetical protein